MLPKLNINQDNKDLKIYFFTIQGGPMQITMAEDFKAILAYTDQEAVNMVRKDYPTGRMINVSKRGQLEVKRIIDILNIPEPNPIQHLELQVAPSPPREQTIKDFVLGLMFLSDKFIDNPRDRSLIKRILSKIKIDETPPALPAAENPA